MEICDTEQRYTARNYEALPETGPRYQLVAGELHMTLAPGTRHQRWSRDLAYLLLTHARTVGGEVFYAPFDVYLSDTDVVQPDLLYVSSARAGRISARGLEGAPDLAIEILSPSTDALDRGPKLKLYARTGVLELWLIDPTTETVAVYDPTTATDAQAVYGADDPIRSQVLPGFRVCLADVI